MLSYFGRKVKDWTFKNNYSFKNKNNYDSKNKNNYGI